MYQHNLRIIFYFEIVRKMNLQVLIPEFPYNKKLFCLNLVYPQIINEQINIFIILS